MVGVWAMDLPAHGPAHVPAHDPEWARGALLRVPSRRADEQFGPREPLGVEDLVYRVKGSPHAGGVLVAVYAGSRRVGGMDAYSGGHVPDMKCASDVMELIGRHPELEDTSRPRWVRSDGQAVPRVQVLSVSRSRVDESVRGRGVGRSMYLALMRAWFDRVGPFLFMPDECGIVGVTSEDARRVWRSLARSGRYPSSGLVLAVLTRP